MSYEDGDGGMSVCAPFFCLHISHARPTLRFFLLFSPVRSSSSPDDMAG